MEKWFVFKAFFATEVENLKSTLSLFSPYYAEHFTSLCGAHLRFIAPRHTAFFEEISQRWRAVGKSCVRIDPPEI